MRGGKLTSLRGLFLLDSTRQMEVLNLGPQINTSDDEYAPAVAPDGLMLYYVHASTGEGPYGAGTGSRGATTDANHDIWVTSMLVAGDTLFTPPQSLGGPINSNLNEGAVTISADNRTILFTGCLRPEGRGDCDIYLTELSSPGKRTIRNLTEINTAEWESEPAISSDGKTLLFTSNRKENLGGFGDADIYESRLGANGVWSAPRNLGKPINTTRREYSPCLAMGDSVLFFASAGHGGLGGIDIFASVRQADGSWGEPRNLGPLFNSSDDDRYISATRDGSVLYYASKRRDVPHAGGFDIFVARRAPGAGR